MAGSREDVAKAIMALTYVEMMEMSEALATNIKEDQEQDYQVDLTNRDHVADRLRWWAEGYLEALEDERAEESQEAAK